MHPEENELVVRRFEIKNRNNKIFDTFSFCTEIDSDFVSSVGRPAVHTLTQGGGQLARGQISYHVGKQYMQLFVSVSLSLQLPPVGVSTLSFFSDVKTTCESTEEAGPRFRAAIWTTPMCGPCDS